MNSLFISFHSRLLCLVSSILLMVCVTAFAEDTTYTEYETQEDNNVKTEVIETETQPQTPVYLPPPPKPYVNNDVKRQGENDNRTGIRINFCYFHGDISKRLYDRTSGEYKKVSPITQYYNFFSDYANYNVLDETKYLFRIQLAVMIKAGRFISIDIGPSLTLYREVNGFEYTDPIDPGLYVDDEYKLKITGPCITFGINFVKRFYPIKINVGILGDVNFNIISTTQKITYTEEYDYYAYSDRERNTDFQMNFSFGPRAGIEFFAGKRFSFNIDFLYRYYMLKNDLRMKIMVLDYPINFDYVDYTMASIGSKWKFILPGLGGGTGINIYF